MFGDLHVHTSLSYDANLSGTRLGPRTAYEFARGNRIDITPYDEDGNALRTLQLERPLDFAAATDHSAHFGSVALCRDPDSVAYAHPECQQFRTDPEGAFLTLVLPFTFSGDHPALCGDAGEDCIEAGKEVWLDVQAAANEANDQSPACNFTSFVAFEWTASPGGNNMHRNVVFRSATVPSVPPDPFNAKRPEAMWQMLRDDCIDAGTGCDVITLAHNTNLSAGTYFQRSGKEDLPLDAEYLRERAVMEPAIEIYQQKGSSECARSLGAPDEFCGFEEFPYPNFTALSLDVIGAPVAGGFARDAFGRGMELERDFGVNPFRYAVIAGTDAHMANPGAVAEYDHPGNGDAVSRVQVSADPLEQGLVDDPYFGSGGLAGVWAEENSREAIFDAVVRKETFGTSGPRIVPRFFAGWSYPEDICDRASLESEGYESGVPMGRELPSQPEASAVPIFVAFARQDPGTEGRPGTPLQRVQIIKGWLDDGGEVQTRVTDVTPDADNGAGVDLATCESQGTGHASLCHRWVDEDFDPSQRAYYYLRVLENPTCRWSVRQCLENGYDCENPTTNLDSDCCDPVVGLNRTACADVACENTDLLTEHEARCCLPPVELTIQERAWTSPIWYTP
ncbi:MAG: DUF3604 domain-containing protein [Deltaproteobacteria bacterium]|nr:DUF3604 domain-containing protein [Deltaproteobacteria bacterium]MBW2550174.1 DUF3604 domain-containing protein [Deltaproteobacteria bacterium]